MDTKKTTQEKEIAKKEKRITHDPAIPLLDMYPKQLKAGSPRGICRPMFIAALFMTAKL